MKFSPVFLFFCFYLTFIYIIGLLVFLTDHEPGNNCQMTYMFEYPQYVRVSQKIDAKYPKYGLYAYGEGRTTKKARNMYFDGIPVLFVPGNAGSHKQVRSLASVALRKTLNSGAPFHFDYFTVDLNNEFSALYGPILYEELDYVTYSIRKILDLYKNIPNRPQKVIIIGHSVGGILAKRAISNLESSHENLVSILITLATPLKRAPLYFDRYGSKFYKNIHTNQEEYSTINVAGGYSDFLVPTYLVSWKGNNTLNLVASSIPKSWVESGHVQILWCKQTILAINRALFDSVDLKTLQISRNVSLVQQTFSYHLVHNSGSKLHLESNYQEVSKIDYKGEWFESIYNQYTVDHKKGIKQPYWYMVGLTTHSYDMLTVLAINLEVTNWIFACNAGYPKGPSRVCTEGEHLTKYSEIAPSVRYKRRLVTLNLREIKTNHSEYTHVVIRALPTSEPVTIHVDVYRLSDRIQQVSLPKFSLRMQTVIEYTAEKAVFYELIFPDLYHVLQNYQLFVEPISCNEDQHHATATLIVPWANENRQAYFTERLKKPFILRLQNVKPPNASDARVRLTLEPSCLYRISVKQNVFGIFSHVARYYSTFLITSVAVVFLLVFQNQIYILSKTGSMPIVFSSVFHVVRYSWMFIIAAGVLSVLLSYPLWTKFLPQPEVMTFPNSGNVIDLIVMPLILHMISVVIVLVLVSIYCVSLFALESTVHKLTLKLLARSVTLTIRFSDYFMTFLHKVPFIVSAILIVLCFSTCGGLALSVGMVFYFLKLTQMSQDIVERITWFVIKRIGKKLKRMFGRKTPTPNRDNADQTSQRSVEHRPDKESETSTAHTEFPQEEGESSNAQSKTEVENVELVEEHEEESELSLKCLTKKNNSIFFHSSMFLMWFMVMTLNLPAVLIWAHNFKYSKYLRHDESFLPGLLLSISAFPLWQFQFPANNNKCSHELRLIILYFTVVILIYGTVSVFVVNYLLTILFVLVVLQQYYNLISANESEQASGGADADTKEEQYDEMKAKLD